MKPINIILFKRFMRKNGINQIFAGLYRQFHFPESPEDIEEYLKKVDSNDVILNAFRFSKNLDDYKYGAEFWLDVAVKWNISMQNASKAGYYMKTGNSEWIEREIQKPLAYPNKHAIATEIKAETYGMEGKEAKVVTPLTRPEPKIDKKPVVEERIGISEEQAVVQKFEFLDFRRVAARKVLDEKLISFHNHSGNYSLTFNKKLSDEIWNSKLIYAHFSFTEDKKIFAIVFSNDPNKGLVVRQKTEKGNFKIANKMLVEYIAKFFNIREVATTLKISSNKAITKDYLTYHITK